MLVYVNDNEVIVPDSCVINDLLKQLGYIKAVVVWVNDRKLLQKEYSESPLKQEDRVKIIRFLGGG